MAITLERTGSRIYLVGNTFPIKDQIKSIGGHWDGDRKAWWVGTAKASDAEKLAAGAAASNGTSDKPKVGDDSKVVAKATYKGRSYYVLWMGRCASGAEKAHLTVLDGKIDFWADLSACQITKTYQPREYRTFRGRTTTTYTTLGSIRSFIEREKANRANGGDVCAACGTSGELVRDLEDGLMKHPRCCDMAP